VVFELQKAFVVQFNKNIILALLFYMLHLISDREKLTKTGPEKILINSANSTRNNLGHSFPGCFGRTPQLNYRLRYGRWSKTAPFGMLHTTLTTQWSQWATWKGHGLLGLTK